MSHVSPKVHRGARVLVAVLSALTLLLLSSSWSADAATTDNAQLSLTGVVDGNNPTGGSELGVHPGTTVSFTASAAPTQKVKDLVNSIGLGSLLGGLLGNVTFQVKADFSGLPGGHSNTVLSGNTSAHFTFSHTGTYAFTYQAQKVTVGLLGKTIAPINLDGNQAKQAGVELNASNNYVGKIVVSNNPKNGISIQAPTVTLHPKVAGHNLPNVTLPGVTTPKIRTSVPDITNPIGSGKGSGGGKGSGSGKSGGGATTTPKDPTYELPVPARVMGSIGSSSGYYGGGSGGFYGESVGGTTGNSLGSTQASTPTTSNGGGSAPAATTDNGATPTKRTADLASNPASSAQLPIVLAILAIVALSLVTATYARLFLLRRSTAS